MRSPSAKAANELSERYTLEQWKVMLKAPALVVAAYDDKKLVGISHGHGNGVDWTIEQSIVHPDYRRQGIGTELRIRINERCASETPHGGTIRGILTNPSQKFWKQLPGMRMTRFYIGVRRIGNRNDG
jgi:GNAT superfamily N-acetyltransferase